MIAAALQVAAMAATADGPAPAGAPSPWEWSGVPRVVAVGDLHGSLDRLIQLLTAAELLDGELRWSGGQDHLVVAGDFLDRGDQDRPLMDLLRRLEEESKAAAGRVHVLLGNHEVMNLMRDTRYVSAASYGHFAGEERQEERQTALERLLLSVKGRKSSRSEALAELESTFPPGYFARTRSFDAEGEYGGWLLRLPTVVKINGVAYVHGGLSEESAALGIDGINRRVAEELRRHLGARAVLEAEGLVTAGMDYVGILGAARELIERRKGSRSPTRLEAAARVWLDSVSSPVLGAAGPLWYRGNAFEDERLERETIERSLELIGATALVVAHSPTLGNGITSRFHGQLFRVDHAADESEVLLALVAEKGEVLVLDSVTKEKTPPVPEPPPGMINAFDTHELPDAAIEKLLSRSLVSAERELGRGSTRPRLVVVERKAQKRRGIFKTVQIEGDAEAGRPSDRYQHEVAAYRLDRALELEMVPVTVVREIAGERGSLQLWIEGAVDQEASEAYELNLDRPEPIRRQLAHANIFDALIGNFERHPADLLYLPDRRKVLLIDHTRAFPASSEIPGIEGRVVTVEPALARALRALDRKSLEKRLGDLISVRQIEALLERRDRILERAEILRPRPHGPLMPGGAP